jgi:hypothetical protein
VAELVGLAVCDAVKTGLACWRWSLSLVCDWVALLVALPPWERLSLVELPPVPVPVALLSPPVRVLPPLVAVVSPTLPPLPP